MPPVDFTFSQGITLKQWLLLMTSTFICKNHFDR
uniref:Uncharacterized protein n=1 Tax=Schistosoma haematobium TaxID=6185 RepID=A0A095AEU0_SCHHA